MLHYRNHRLCRVPEALGKDLKTLSKLFAECRTRQRGLGIQCIGKAVFAGYFFSDTRQRLCRVLGSTRQRKAAVTAPGDGDGVFAECHRIYLCRVSVGTLDKETGTRQRSGFR